MEYGANTFVHNACKSFSSYGVSIHMPVCFRTAVQTPGGVMMCSSVVCLVSSAAVDLSSGVVVAGAKNMSKKSVQQN